jgi:undecaprenyl-phosphate 4-deoxy-4-formamido-L-arabinose transferase
MTPPVSSLSVVVPVYQSEDVLPALVARLEPVLRTLADEFELILVNDASPDGSWGVIRELCQAHRWVRGIDLMRNSGQHNALLCGIRAARCELIVTIDDDLQNPPEEIAKLLAAMDDSVDVVYGAPEREVHGVMRDLASQVTKVVLQGALGADTARMVSPFRLFRTSTRRAFRRFRGGFSANIDVLLTWGTTRFRAVRVRHDERQAGRSHYTLGTLLTHALNMLTGFSTLPLRVASALGFVLTLFGVVLMVFVLARYAIYGVAVPGFAFLASIIILFSGTQLFTLGVIGEYLSRMHVRLLDRPAYVVRERETGRAEQVAL